MPIEIVGEIGDHLRINGELETTDALRGLGKPCQDVSSLPCSRSST
jgi:hypothetical protein